MMEDRPCLKWGRKRPRIMPKLTPEELEALRTEQARNATLLPSLSDDVLAHGKFKTGMKYCIFPSSIVLDI